MHVVEIRSETIRLTSHNIPMMQNARLPSLSPAYGLRLTIWFSEGMDFVSVYTILYHTMEQSQGKSLKSSIRIWLQRMGLWLGLLVEGAIQQVRLARPDP